MEPIAYLPAAPAAVFDGGEGELVLVFAAHIAALRKGRLEPLASGEVGGAALGPDGRLYCTLGSRVLSIDPHRPGEPAELTARFGGAPEGGRRVACMPDGEVWVEGCAKVRRPDGAFQSAPRCPVAVPPPVPLAVDIYGNRWSLVRGEGGRQWILVLPMNASEAWQVVPLDEDAGSWNYLVADAVGFVWVAGEKGLRRFYPHRVDAGWQVVAEGLPQSAVTALGLSPEDLALAGYASGELVELDVSADGETRARTLGRVPAAVQYVHTDRQGNIWVAAGGELYRQNADPRAWQKDWQKLGRLPGGNHDIFAVPLRGKLYVAGGVTAGWGFPARTHVFDELFAYNPGTGCWEVISRMPFPRCYNGIAELDGRIWVVGGSANLGEPENPDGKRLPVEVVDIYDPGSNTWILAPPLNTPRMEPIVLASGSRIYAIGGASDPEPALATVESIAPEEKTWRFETPLPAPVRQAAGCVLDGILYCVNKDGFFAYDPQTGEWDTDLPQLSESPQAALVTAFGGEIWVMGGYRMKTTHRYAPGERKWRPGPQLPTEQSWGAAAVLGDRLIIAGGAHWSEVHQTYIFDDRTYVLRGDAD